MSLPLMLEDFLNAKMKEMNVGMVCEIVSYDKDAMTANVRPFLQTESEGKKIDYPILSKVKCQFLQLTKDFYFKPDYAQGDLVWVTFSTFDMSKAYDKMKSAESERLFGLENACVVDRVPTQIQSTIDSYMYFEDDTLKVKIKGVDVAEFGESEVKFPITTKTGPTEVDGKQHGHITVLGPTVGPIIPIQ